MTANVETSVKEKTVQGNILKSRDDQQPIVLIPKDNEAANSHAQFVVSENSYCSWAKPGDLVDRDKLRPRIEPWLTALCQSEHFSILLGSGLTHAVHRIATGALLPGMAEANFADHDDLIKKAARKSAEAAGRPPGNLEDQLRVANELWAGLTILALGEKTVAKTVEALREAVSKALSGFAGSILHGEHALVHATDDKRELAFNYLVSFLMSFASRTGTRDRLHIFTTNYDRYIEAGAELAGLHLLDRFVGSLAPIFRSSRLDLDMHYNPPGIRGEPRYLEGVARYTKLHGSVDWLNTDRDIRRAGVPFGATDIAPYLGATGEPPVDATRLMIYPNAAKDRETASYPYVELFRDLAAAICRPNHTLITFGYSFGDEHINRVVEDMLTVPSTHVVVISYSDPLGRIMETYRRLGRHAQISLLIGDHLGDLETLVDNYLPKPAIDRTTFRMAELLKARWSTRAADKLSDAHDDSTPTEGDQ